MPDAARAGFRVLPSCSRRKGHPPVSTSSNRLSTRHQRFACARLSQPRLPGSGPDVSATLTTIALDDSSLRWLEACTCLPTSKGPPSSLVQFRTVVLRQCVRDTRPEADLRIGSPVGSSWPNPVLQQPGSGQGASTGG